MPLHAYISRRAVLPEGVRPAAVIVDTGTGLIHQIAEAEAYPPVDQVFDLGANALLPGLIDPHVHINSPGRDHWEGFESATRAAAAGGLTTLIDMPLNNLPETITVESLELKRRAADGRSQVDLRFWGGAVNGNAAHLLPLAQAGVPGFKCFLLYPGCDGLGLIDEAHLHEAMPRITETGLPLLVHAELAGPLESAAASLAGADWRQYRTYLASRPDAAETDAVELMIRMVRRYGTRVHIVHVSSAEVLPLLARAKAEGLPITAETCTHYLFFNAEEIPDGATEFKCAPPIRSARNRDLLWAALGDGTLDLVASDHSPCPPEMKDLPALGGAGNFQKAWGGISSLSLGLSALWTGLLQFAQPVDQNLSHIARWMAQSPAELAGVAGRKGRIEVGYDADLVIFDPDAQFTVTARDLHFRHLVSPYLRRRLTGRVRQTVLRGVTVYKDHKDGGFPNPGCGREVLP